MIVWSLIVTSAGLNLVQEVMSVEPKIISYLLLTRHCSVDQTLPVFKRGLLDMVLI